MMTRTAWLLALSIGAGCVTNATDEGSGPAVCDGKCDDGSSTASPLVSCFVEPSTEADPFFRVDALHCSFAPPSAAGLSGTTAYVEVHGANGKVSSDRRTEAGGFTLAGLDQDAYPAQLIVSYNLGSIATPGITSLGQQSVKETYTLASPTTATAAQPIDVTLPFVLWHVQLTNRSSETTNIRLEHDLGAALAVDEYVRTPYGARTELYVAAPRGATSVPVSVLGATTTTGQFAGSGDYEITAAGALVHADAPAQPTGAVTAVCSRSVTSVGGAADTEIQCSPIADRATVTVTVDIEPSTGAPVTLDLTDTKQATFDGSVDARITVHATVTDALADLKTLTARTFTQTGTLTDATDSQLATRLPFTIAQTRWIAAAGVVGFIQVPGREFDLGDHTQAVVTIGEREVSLQPSEDVTEYFVLAPGASLTGDGLAVPTSSGSAVENIVVPIDGDATYDVTAAGITRR